MLLAGLVGIFCCLVALLLIRPVMMVARKAGAAFKSKGARFDDERYVRRGVLAQEK